MAKLPFFKLGWKYHGNIGGHIGSVTRAQLGICFHTQMGQYAGYSNDQCSGYKGMVTN